MYKKSLLDKLERKVGRYALRNLMTIIVVGTVIVWLLDYFVYMRTGVSLSAYLTFDKAAILEGQVWRILTFIFIPDTANLIILMISLYFYWLIGNTLENEWGSFRFDVFYLCGILGAIISGFITGYATNSYLNLSLFLAFAILYPDHTVLLFFFIPIKIKYLALIDAIGLIVLFIFGTWAERLVLLMALLNIILFFTRDFVDLIKRKYRSWKYRRDAMPKEKTFKTKKSKRNKADEEWGETTDDNFPFEL